MQTPNIHEAKADLSRRTGQASKGESFLTAEAGEPMVRVMPIEPGPPHKPQRLGFMKCRAKIPDDFDTMYADEIARMFNGGD